MITLTNDEAIKMLMALSRIDGYMFSVSEDGHCAVHEEIDWPCDLLLEKLNKKKSAKGNVEFINQ